MRYIISALILMLLALSILTVPAYAVTILSPQEIAYDTNDITLNWTYDVTIKDLYYDFDDAGNISLCPLDDTLVPQWRLDMTLSAGLFGAEDQYIHVTMFNESGTDCMIKGDHTGLFYGYNRSGSETVWIEDASLVSGLVDVGQDSTPEVFSHGGQRHLIASNSDSNFYGYSWNGTGWVSNATMVSGLVDYGHHGRIETFMIGSDLHCITSVYGSMNGYGWNGTAWQSNSSIVTGLTGSTREVDLTMFYMDDTLYSIKSEWYHNLIKAYNWTGTAWYEDAYLSEGLVGQGADPSTEMLIHDSEYQLYISTTSIYSLFSSYFWEPDETYTYDTILPDLPLADGDHDLDIYVNTGTDDPDCVCDLLLSRHDGWLLDNSKDAGVDYMGQDIYLTIFELDSIRYMVSGKQDGTFAGYRWNGSSWLSDAGIISGLDIGIYTSSSPTAFIMDSQHHMVVGKNFGDYSGFSWNGTGWQSNATMISGLTDIGTDSRPTVFEYGSTWYMIAKGETGAYAGYNWTGSGWQSDAGIINGIGVTGYIPKPATYMYGDELYLVISTNDKGFFTYAWNGSSWEQDILRDVGLPTSPTISTGHVSSVFYEDDILYLMTYHSPMYLTAYRWYDYTDALNRSVNGTFDHEHISLAFTTDTVYPQISFIDPTLNDSTTVQTATATVNLSVADDNLDTVILSWNNTNETLEETVVVKIFGDDGIYTYRACTNDTAGNVNCTGSRSVTSEYQSYQAYLESIATITGTKKIGEVPAGAILGLTENVGIGTAINFVLLAVVIGFGLFGYSSIKAGRGLKS